MQKSSIKNTHLFGLWSGSGGGGLFGGDARPLPVDLFPPWSDSIPNPILPPELLSSFFLDRSFLLPYNIV